ncbi:spore gernimation protein [Paenibacillus sp. D9]|nr:spore gernimation protein [Paenibacillus sp. D9]
MHSGRLCASGSQGRDEAMSRESGGSAPAGVESSWSGSYVHNMALIRKSMETNADIKLRAFTISHGREACLAYVDGLADLKAIDMLLLSKLGDPTSDEGSIENVELAVRRTLPSIIGAAWSDDYALILNRIRSGSTALLMDGLSQALLLETVKDQTRSLEEPISEAVLRGPRIGFCESLQLNTALLRSAGEAPNMAMEKMTVGREIRKEVMIVYMTDIVRAGLVEEVKKRIAAIDIDHLPESGYVEQLVEDNFLSPFQQIQNTERPDRVIAGILEGRVGILLDGTPFALLAPATFSMLIQSPEDYYDRWLPGSLIRLLRFASVVICLLTPALYIAFTSFHPGLIPTKLALSIIGARQGVPFPSLIETLIMEVSIEILREAGLRLPKPIGPAMGIVGGLIIGDAAVQAGIVSPILVIVVAITAISSFVIPQYSAGITLRILRFAAMICAATFGLYGVVLFILLLLAHLARLESFGVPYLSPLVPYRPRDWKDLLLRLPLPLLRKRPSFLSPQNEFREDNG